MSVYGSGFGSPPEPPVWQPPEHPRQPRRSRWAWITGVAVGAAFAAGIGGFLAASGSGGKPTNAAASSPTTSSTTTPSKGPVPRPGVGPRLGGNVLHGTYTVQTGTNTYQTYDVQVGTVNPVSSSSITVKSADGFVSTYSVTSSTVVDAQRDGIASVSSGDKVRLVATVSGNTRTATDIVDVTKVGNAPGRWGGAVRGPGPFNGSGTGPAPAA